MKSPRFQLYGAGSSMNIYNREAYSYSIPQELIAQYPLKDRSSARLMVVDRKSNSIEHKVFTDIINYLNPGDVLVLNVTKVFPARLYGNKETGANVEILLVQPNANNEWLCLVKPGQRAKTGNKIIINEHLTAEVLSTQKGGIRLIKFHCEQKFMSLLEKYGKVPLPSYIDREAIKEDKKDYQTVYAKDNGSVAAPTAGLHFTNELLQKIKYKGVNIAEVTLHVGIGTFRPVYTEDIREHKMHAEYCSIPQETADMINQAKQAGKRIIAVGTTSTRTLESFATGSHLEHGTKWTDIFIYPGKKLNIIDAQITNFHTPASTLLMLVSAFAGYDLTMTAYQKAIEERYRFFSYGDAMLIK
jgi:S-adenosylmethionine:tRNA ribosyltransferase-isomerase